MSITIALPTLVIVCVAFVLLIAALILCWQQGLFGGSDTYGIGCMFSIAIMAVVFAIPSLLLWAVYATWFK